MSHTASNRIAFQSTIKHHKQSVGLSECECGRSACLERETVRCGGCSSGGLRPHEEPTLCEGLWMNPEQNRKKGSRSVVHREKLQFDMWVGSLGVRQSSSSIESRRELIIIIISTDDSSSAKMTAVGAYPDSGHRDFGSNWQLCLGFAA
jgi:hypothetical protein